jgi:Domain of unknown function (DUF6894)
LTRYYFHFRKGREVTRDRIGMYLPNLDAARAEALHAWGQVLMLARTSGEVPDDCEIQIVDQTGETVLGIPIGERRRLH